MQTPAESLSKAQVPFVHSGYAKKLSDLISYDDTGYGVYRWMVFDKDNWFTERADAFEDVRGRFPMLEDDELE